MRLGTCLLLLLIADGVACGCSCDSAITSRCQQMRAYRGQALFLGTVTEIRYRNAHFGKDSMKEQVVTFSIQDAFKGINKKTVTVSSFAEPGMCGFRFRRGRSYLVDGDSYADVSEFQTVNVSSCGMTIQAEWAEDDIHFLRTLRANPHGAIIFGTVKQYPVGSTFVSLNNKAIAGATILLESAPDALLHAERLKASADAAGWYEFAGLPEGTYTATAQVPDGLLGVFQHTVEVTANGCAQVDIRAHPKGD